MGQRIILVAGITLLLSFFCFGSAFCDEKKAVNDNFDSAEALIDRLKEKRFSDHRCLSSSGGGMVAKG